MLMTTENPGFCADPDRLHIQFLEWRPASCPRAQKTSGSSPLPAWTTSLVGRHARSQRLPEWLPANELSIEVRPLNGMYTVVFEFDGEGGVTVKSFEPSKSPRYSEVTPWSGRR